MFAKALCCLPRAQLPITQSDARAGAAFSSWGVASSTCQLMPSQVTRRSQACQAASPPGASSRRSSPLYSVHTHRRHSAVRLSSAGASRASELA